MRWQHCHLSFIKVYLQIFICRMTLKSPREYEYGNIDMAISTKYDFEHVIIALPEAYRHY